MQSLKFPQLVLNRTDQLLKQVNQVFECSISDVNATQSYSHIPSGGS